MLVEENPGVKNCCDVSTKRLHTARLKAGFISFEFDFSFLPVSKFSSDGCLWTAHHLSPLHLR